MKELAFLIGEWESEAEDGKVEEWSAHWINNRSYIMITAGDYREIVGWDLTGKHFTSWQFGTDGGQGKAVWTKHGDKWKVETKPYFLDRWGNKYRSEFTMQVIDKDSHKGWAVFHRLDSEQEPKTTEMLWKRKR